MAQTGIYTACLHMKHITQLDVLPLKKESVTSDVWINPAGWPAFGTDGVASSVHGITPIHMRKLTLQAGTISGNF